MIYGTTYSHREIEWLKLDADLALDNLLKLKLNLVRLCCYWSECEPIKGKYDFDKLSGILVKCQAARQNVIVTLGMKGPRWPEFYLPAWLSHQPAPACITDLLSFIKTAHHAFNQFSCIKYWQIENEPLGPSGPEQKKIPLTLLKKEAKLIKQLDQNRPVIITLWMDDFNQPNLNSIFPIADIIGLDLYLRRPFLKILHTGPKYPISHYQNLIKSSPKPIWITELQAEPWEEFKIYQQLSNPPSLNPDRIICNYSIARKINPEAILFWGYEYWQKLSSHGDQRYLSIIKQLTS